MGTVELKHQIKTLAGFPILIILMATTAVAQDKPPDLDTTLGFIQNMLDRYGFIHAKGKDQELKVKGDEPCRIYVKSEIKVQMHTSQDGVYPVEYQFHLGTMDPDSVKVTMDENQ